MNALPIEIHPLSAARLADFMAFFEGEAFADNAHWSSCYCQCFYEDHTKIRWPDRTAAENRACAIRRIAEGRMQGFLAYRSGRVMGWCNAGPRSLFHALDQDPSVDSERVATILCFLVAPSARGQGVASALLAAACRALAERGFSSVEANPRPSATGSADNHFGPLAMYLAADFTVRRTDADGSVWMSKELDNPPDSFGETRHANDQR